MHLLVLGSTEQPGKAKRPPTTTDIVARASEAKAELAKQKQEQAAGKKRMRPARVQAERYDGYEEHQGVYNIWYHKFCGDRDFKRVRRETKLDVEKDVGWTRANRNPQSYICLYFARGCCCNVRRSRMFFSSIS